MPAMYSLASWGSTQAASGLILIYTRTMRPGEYVKVGGSEGTVTEIGLFATRIDTGMGEQVVLPNALVLSNTTRNFSRNADGGGFMVHTGVTISYATPWRQVHAMLLEAASRTPGILQTPPPRVIQTALSDFYVEYRLIAQGQSNVPGHRAETMSALNASVQDVFNEYGVQIMSPHYRSDPELPQVVAKAKWYEAPAKKPPAGN